MKIGLVLPALPKYSETFGDFTIKGLLDSGFEITVFSSNTRDRKKEFEIVNAYPVYKNSLLQLFPFIFVLVWAFVRSPSKVLRLYSLERDDGHSVFEALKIVYLNSHIITHTLDWLHFGFARMALKHENVAHAMGARMGVSLRGVDINIYPIKFPGCYSKLWKKVDKVHTISHYLYTKALRLGLSKEKSFVKISPAIDISQFKMKENAGQTKNPLKILTVGRLNWIKDYETAISAMENLKLRGMEFMYSIVGAGEELERLKYAVHQLKLGDRIFF